MVLFYENSDYAPYAVDGWGVSLTTSVSEPLRAQNRIIIEVDECLMERTACQGSQRAIIYFNFTGANQMGAARRTLPCPLVHSSVNGGVVSISSSSGSTWLSRLSHSRWHLG